MIEIQNVRLIDKGTLFASCDVHIKPWKMTLKEVKIFQKGVNRWINLPSKEVVQDTGEKKYHEMIVFDDDNIKNRFRTQVTAAIDEYIAANPDLKPEPVIKDEECPF